MISDACAAPASGTGEVSPYSDSRERFREFRVRLRSRFAIHAAAGFMNLIQP
jgi:hypothetical protein